MQPGEEKYKGRYRVSSTRLQGYDYSQTGLYFVTICTRGREKYFGEVKEGIVELSEIGEAVKEELLKTMEIRPNVNIDEWVIMPNHVHVIVALDNQNNERQYNGSITVETPRGGVFHGNDDNAPNGWVIGRETRRETPQRGVSTDDNGRSWKPSTLGSIINQFKGACTKIIHKKFPNVDFSWQSRFHDHVIRNEKSLQTIRRYILDNPIKWLEDELFIE
ncbi:MAG: hypothetical protein A2754_02475 [Candidatus Magasanikbacteria bacterium RIFCSPHIGHO2_01_FULL_47_8]|uniref:Transposase IS200-like domain-containing protein n=1 Tax=Candidatus Magasanikbacteria bacterium RIFCSPHIGHO2_01_FULL_47_8 TaxID=1798673 RepID=A0A1F6MBM0_9BACT|nr:MAG: hypothetical protein A2754_02475 [Candidatus Magasanikbacteria bacterium RIFCSPHIGHO2_01_FULL_47_8]